MQYLCFMILQLTSQSTQIFLLTSQFYFFTFVIISLYSIVFCNGVNYKLVYFNTLEKQNFVVSLQFYCISIVNAIANYCISSLFFEFHFIAKKEQKNISANMRNQRETFIFSSQTSNQGNSAGRAGGP